MSEQGVCLRGITVEYRGGPPWARERTLALHGVDLDIDPGETLGLVGETGSGKTTVGRVVLGLVKPTTGTATLDGEPLRQAHKRHRGRIQVVLQHPQWSMNPRLQVGTSIAEPLAVTRDLPRRKRAARVTAMLEEVGLDPALAERLPHELSGGQLQRASIARALITNPRYVVFDEPVSALDVSAQAQVLNLIKRAQAEHGFSALFISHQIEAVRYVAQRLAVMYRGTVVAEGAATTFYEQPAHPYSRALLTDGEGWPPSGSSTAAPIDVEQCPFAGACPLTVDRCCASRPVLRRVGGQLSACHRAEELLAPRPTTATISK